jgi:hypothetical protein
VAAEAGARVAAPSTRTGTAGPCDVSEVAAREPGRAGGARGGEGGNVRSVGAGSPGGDFCVNWLLAVNT